MRNKKITKKLLRKQKRAYDRLAKETMRDTRLLAFLIKDCVHPFKNDPLSFIQKGIDSDQGHIPYAGGEISFVSGAYIVPDLLFTMKKGEWSACGNIEFQKDRPKKYDLSKRVHLYEAAMYCNQVGRKIDYRKLRPVYSIWVLNDFRIEQGKIQKTAQEEEMNRTIFEVGNEVHEEDADSLKILHYLFKCTDANIANENLARYGFDTKKDRKKVETMCNLSQGFIERGIALGREQGLVLGEKKGKQQGKITASVNAILRISKDFDLPLLDVYHSQSKDLSVKEAKLVRKQLGI